MGSQVASPVDLPINLFVGSVSNTWDRESTTQVPCHSADTIVENRIKSPGTNKLDGSTFSNPNFWVVASILLMSRTVHKLYTAGSQH